jgi:hypothetical protein
MTFDRPFDRSSTSTNAHGIAPAIASAIGFDRPFDRLSTIPPYPPSDRRRLARAFHPLADTAALSLRSRPQALDRPVIHD